MISKTCDVSRPRNRKRPTLGWALHVLLAAVVAVLGFAGCVVSAFPADAATGPAKPSAHPNVVTFGTQTASSTKPDTRGFYNFGATAGGRLLDHVALRNYSTQPVTVAIKGTDAENDANGDLVFRPVNQKSVDLGQWIEVLRSDLTVTIPPRSNVIIPFLVVVPQNATPGDHVGGITASLESSVVSKSSHGSRVKLLQTVGSEIFVRVSGPLRLRLTIQHLTADYTGTADPIGTGTVRLRYRVVNGGNVALGGSQTVYVSGLFGQKRYALHIKNLPLLLPGNSTPEFSTIADVYPEMYDSAHVSVRPLPLAGSVTPALKSASAAVSFWAVPWTALAVIAALAAAIAVLVVRRRRGRPRHGARSGEGPGSPPEGPGRKLDTSSFAPAGANATNDTTPADAIS